ncbi:GNAT family N-acetyltransferase [Desulfospira joergensenii]|uniref:GNAT family N-acetyltransferase n=1 Tax=Desulfospira joergensenii TaxID=53329 RepID=UPI0003B47A6B|nr:GNAT family N-acetyltransferase [Desulfospira joergensenii]
MECEVIRFVPAYLDEIASMDLEIFGKKEAYPRAFFRQAHDILGNLFYLAKTEDGKIAGYILGGVNPETGQGWVIVLGVLPGQRRKGLAKKLLSFLLKDFEKKSISRVRLSVSPENSAACGLYKNTGFDGSHIIPDYFGPGESRIIYEKSLSPSR